MEKGELALCYYKSPSSREKSGWIFLSDVTNVVEKYDEGTSSTGKDPDREKSGISYDSIYGNGFKWIHVCHPSRTYKLLSEDVNEYNLWFKTLRQICQIGESNQCHEEGGANLMNLENISPVIKVKANKTVLQPASPTYEKEHSSFNESTTSIEKNHEAEIEFIREITSSKIKKANNDIDHPISHRKFHFHNEKLVEEKAYNLDIDSCTPSYHEIITKSGIEQHTLLSMPGNEPLHFHTSSTTNNSKALMVDQHNVASIDDREGTGAHDADIQQQQQGERSENWKTDHRLDYSLNNSYDANETIHKRIERAILNPNNHDNKFTSNPPDDETLNNTSYRDQSDSMPKIDDKAMDSNTATITMVEELSFGDDDDSERSDFVTPKSHVHDELADMNDDNSPENEDKMLREIQIGSVSLRKDVLSLKHHDFNDDEEESKDMMQRNENSTSMMESDRFETPDKDFLMNDWDENEHQSYSARRCKLDNSPSGQQPCESIDSDCSYRPDENFVEDEWD